MKTWQTMSKSLPMMKATADLDSANEFTPISRARAKAASSRAGATSSYVKNVLSSDVSFGIGLPDR